ncbi:bifunctional adenosylcobinamide kinase/adenosylcobinamide-phosphate guanylyltransferase [Streptacidiphilus sp. 4-A2]|nr:bifunctional adenosylcobinamide kinase/adenosylcobinamide-phosphate guanylyltransferase [Streptacidiphilus sp. 4-A2]
MDVVSTTNYGRGRPPCGSSLSGPGAAARLGLEFGGRPRPAVRRTLVLGGARSGKSVTAERLLADRPDVLYVATGGSRDGDAEWAQRVALHRERRPAAWGTAETCALEPLLAAPGGPLLVDCLALWLTHTMDECQAWDDEAWAATGEARLRARTAALVDAWRDTPRRVVAVSNEVGSGVVPATASGRRFRDELGRLNSAVASASEEVLLVVAGQPLRIRG